MKKNLLLATIMLIWLPIFSQSTFSISLKGGISNVVSRNSPLSEPKFLGLLNVADDFAPAFSVGVEYLSKPSLKILDWKFHLLSDLNLDYRNLYVGKFRDHFGLSNNIFIVCNPEKKYHLLLGYKHGYLFFNNSDVETTRQTHKYLKGWTFQNYYQFSSHIKVGITISREVDHFQETIRWTKFLYRRVDMMLNINYALSQKKDKK